MYTKFELEAIDRINKVKNEKLPFLDLSGLQLTDIPNDISDMYYLMDLDLSYNQLSKVPNDVLKLTNLHYLNLSNNSLRDVEFEFGVYYSLREIDISNNYIYSFPFELVNLKNDLEIIFEGNPFLNDLPVEIPYDDDLSYMYFYFDTLRNHVSIKRLFETKLLIVGKGEVGKTTLMKTLKNPSFEVNIGKEQTTHGINIDYYTTSVLFPAIKKLYDLRTDVENIWIREDEEVHDENYEDENEKVHVRDSSDIDFDNDGNIISKVNFYRKRLRHISDYVDYTDFILSLNVSDDPYRQDHDLFFEKDVKVNIWDFGGQEILYSTHQFFLTKRSIYIFVWEPRTDNEEESFDYWLNVISRLSNNSPIIVVMNKSDIRIKRIDETSYRKTFKNIVDFLNISCYTKEGIDKLNETINHTICTLPHIGDRLPQIWDTIRSKLKELNKNYISYSKFRDISNSIEVNDTYYLSEYLNDLGDIIHFKNNIILKDFVVLNPQWLVEAIYELMHSVEIQKNNGIFYSANLSSHLDNTKYPEEKHYEILSLMEEFEICFGMIGTKGVYIIPALLQTNISDDSLKENFKILEATKYKIEYRFLPSGLVERLICRLSNYLDSDNFWKYGAIFKTETSKALIELNKLEKSLNLFVVGEVKSELYSLIVLELKQVHSDLKLDEDDYTELYACHCSECVEDLDPYMYKRSDLLRYIQKGKKEIECRKSTISISIEDLLAGYTTKSEQHDFLREYVNAMSILQNRTKIIESLDENQINTYFQDLLRPNVAEKGYFLNEQSLKGKSKSGKKQGELDIAVENIKGVVNSFIEGFVLNSYNASKVNEHINKTVINYDTNGLKEKYIGVYSRANNFSNLSNKYLQHLLDLDAYADIIFLQSNDVSNFYSSGSEMKIFKTIYKRSEVELNLYHVLININQ